MAAKTARRSGQTTRPRRYTDANREAFIAAWEMNGRNTKRTCRQLDIPKSTAIGWIRKLVDDENQPTREQAREQLTVKCWQYAAKFLDIMLLKSQNEKETLYQVVGAFIKACEYGMNLEFGRVQAGGPNAQAGANASVLVGVKSEQSVSLSGMSTEEINARLAGLLERLGTARTAGALGGMGAPPGNRLGEI